MTHNLLRVAFCSSLLWTATAQAATLFSQTPTSNLTAYRSDLSADTNGYRSADNFTVTQPAIARSVVWRGVFQATPPYPVTFNLTVYADDSGTPGSTVSTTFVAFTASGLIDTGIDLYGADIFEFRANLTPTPLTTGTTYWFSPLATTTAGTDDDWFWLSSTSHDLAARQDDVAGSGPWAATAFGPNYFVLSDAIIPEPGSIALLLTGCIVVLGRSCRGLTSTMKPRVSRGVEGF